MFGSSCERIQLPAQTLRNHALCLRLLTSFFSKSSFRTDQAALYKPFVFPYLWTAPGTDVPASRGTPSRSLMFVLNSMETT
ncbi:hypothetical protein TNCT_652681 [Trichonephila clavata]|uniref:Uncharacterized protein n=1 Tax=Trichonephila clavata TaxID=2740835 RepID=A0A8X6L674_TRICU|nr:hypothetical protein TNCT_652681 [Trichonephila clavata]